MTPGLWTVAFAAAAAADLDLIETHLAEAYRSFGESPKEALAHAAARVEAIIAAAERLTTAPFRGQARDDLLPGLRHLSLNSAIYWFVTDEVALEVRVLAIFFGGQDHQRHMLVRLLRKPPA
jgi:toxin ParE1/3/4